MTDDTTGSTGEWIRCYCCARSFPVQNVVRFCDHPDDAVCVRCTEWLHAGSRPIARRLHPLWQLASRIRARKTTMSSTSSRTSEASQAA